MTREVKPFLGLSEIISADIRAARFSLEDIKELFRHPLFQTELRELIDDRLLRLDETKEERRQKLIQVCRFTNVLHKISEQKKFNEAPSFADLLMGL